MARLTILLTTLALGGTAASPVPVEREPMHHVVYADKKLRVYDIVIPPHRGTLFHINYHDLAGVTISPANANVIQSVTPSSNKTKSVSARILIEKRQAY